ncbi:MAG: TSCPD domain-containing protein [Christensenellales bacterium]
MNIYKTHNVCSRSIEFEVENNIITACKLGTAAAVPGASPRSSSA